MWDPTDHRAILNMLLLLFASWPTYWCHRTMHSEVITHYDVTSLWWCQCISSTASTTWMNCLVYWLAKLKINTFEKTFLCKWSFDHKEVKYVSKIPICNNTSIKKCIQSAVHQYAVYCKPDEDWHTYLLVQSNITF